MKVIASVFNSNAKCHRCNEKFKLHRRRQCIICSKPQIENLFCKTCSIKENSSTLGFLAPKRYCIDCHSNSSNPKARSTTSTQEDRKVSTADNTINEPDPSPKLAKHQTAPPVHVSHEEDSIVSGLSNVSLDESPSPGILPTKNEVEFN